MSLIDVVSACLSDVVDEVIKGEANQNMTSGNGSPSEKDIAKPRSSKRQRLVSSTSSTRSTEGEVDYVDIRLADRDFRAELDYNGQICVYSEKILTAMPLKKLLRTQIRDDIKTSSMPESPDMTRGGTVVYFVEDENSNYGLPFTDDDFYPWTEKNSTSKVDSERCSIDLDGVVTFSSDGDCKAIVSRYYHPSIKGLRKIVVRLEEAGVMRGLCLVAYSSEVRVDVPLKSGRKRKPKMSKKKRAAILEKYRRGMTGRQIVADSEDPSLKPQDVYNAGRNEDRRRSNRGIIGYVNHGKILSWKERGLLSERTFQGKSHYFLTNQSMIEVLKANMWTTDGLRRHREEKSKQLERAYEEGCDIEVQEHEVGAAQIDVTFTMCEGFYLTVLAVECSQFETRSTGKRPLLPVAMMLSEHHNATAMRFFGQFVSDVVNDDDLVFSSITCDQETTFDDFIKAATCCSMVTRTDCTVHRMENMKQKLTKEECRQAAQLLFGCISDFGILQGGILNAEDEATAREILQNADLTEDAQKWIQKRFDKLFNRLSLRSRMENGITTPFPSTNKIECVNRWLKSYRERKRRTLDECIELLLELLKAIATYLFMAAHDGGYYRTSENYDERLFPSVLEPEPSTKLPEGIWPVPRGARRLEMDKQLVGMDAVPMQGGFRISYPDGKLVGVVINENGRLDCRASECAAKRTLCLHRLKIISVLPESRTEEFYEEQCKTEMSKLRRPTKERGGKKGGPGLQGKVPRRGTARPDILATRVAPSNAQVTLAQTECAMNIGYLDEVSDKENNYQSVAIHSTERAPVRFTEDDEMEPGPENAENEIMAIGSESGWDDQDMGVDGDAELSTGGDLGKEDFKFHDPGSSWRESVTTRWNLTRTCSPFVLSQITKFRKETVPASTIAVEGDDALAECLALLVSGNSADAPAVRRIIDGFSSEKDEVYSRFCRSAADETDLMAVSFYFECNVLIFADGRWEAFSAGIFDATVYLTCEGRRFSLVLEMYPREDRLSMIDDHSYSFLSTTDFSSVEEDDCSSAEFEIVTGESSMFRNRKCEHCKTTLGEDKNELYARRKVIKSSKFSHLSCFAKKRPSMDWNVLRISKNTVRALTAHARNTVVSFFPLR